MAYAPIALTMPQYEDYANWYLKAYTQGTTTPLSMATDSGGGTLLAKSELDSTGFPTTNGTTRFIPYINGAYDLWMFPTSAEADADDTTNAIQMADNVNADPSASISVTTTRFYATVSAMIADYANVSNGDAVELLGYHSKDGGGGGVFYKDTSQDKANHNGGTIIDPSVTFPSDWTNQTQVATWFTAGTGTGCWMRVTPHCYASKTVFARDFGAKVDGTTFDTKSIQAAIDSLGTTGGVVILGEGDSLTDQLSVSNDDIAIIGTGQNCVLKGNSSATAGTAVILITGDNVTLDNFAINQNNINTGRSIRITSTANTKINRITGTNCQQTFIRADGLLSNLSVTQCSTSTKGYSVWIEDPDAGSSGLVVSNNYFVYPYGSGTGDGIEVNAPTNGFDNIVISSNFINGFYGSALNAGIGIGIANCSNVSITSNVVLNCDSDGIHVEDGSTGIVISGNTVYNCCRTSSGSSAAISVLTACADVSVNGNTVRDSNTRACFGTTSDNGTFTDRLVISGNTFSSANQFIVSLDSVRGCVVSSNMLYDGDTAGTTGQSSIRVTKLGTNVSADVTICDNVIKDSTTSTRSVSFSVSCCNRATVRGNNFTQCGTPSPDVGTGNDVEVRANKLGSDSMSGSFTLTASATSKVVSNTNSFDTTHVSVFPLDSAAGGLIASGAVYVSAVTKGGNFTLTHPSAAGGETFGYRIE